MLLLLGALAGTHELWGKAEALENKILVWDGDEIWTLAFTIDWCRGMALRMAVAWLSEMTRYDWIHTCCTSVGECRYIKVLKPSRR